MQKIIKTGTDLPECYLGTLTEMRQLKTDHKAENLKLVPGDEFYIDSPPADPNADNQEGSLTDKYVWNGQFWSMFGSF